MDTYNYNCQYCGKEYIPKRRRVQKYCRTSCKNNSYYLRKKKHLIITSENETSQEKQIQIDKMSWAGVGNAAAGTVAVNVLTNIFTKEENKPATKKDIKEIKTILSTKDHPIKNHPNRFDGARPFYDMVTQSIVYITKPTNNGTK